MQKSFGSFVKANKAPISVSLIVIVMFSLILFSQGAFTGKAVAPVSKTFYCCGPVNNLHITTSCSDTSSPWNKWGYTQANSCYLTSCTHWCDSQGYTVGTASGVTCVCSNQVVAPDCPDVPLNITFNDAKTGYVKDDSVLNTPISIEGRDSPVLSTLFGKAYSFSSKQRLVLSDNPCFDFGAKQPFTISFWYKEAPAYTNDAVIFSKGTYIIKRSVEGGYGLILDSPSGEASIGTDDEIFGVANSKPHHFTFKRSTNGLTIYIDGQLNESIVSSTAYSIDLATSDAIIIGQDPYAAQGLVGVLDEILVFRKALTDAEVKALYNSYAEILPVDVSGNATLSKALSSPIDHAFDPSKGNYTSFDKTLLLRVKAPVNDTILSNITLYANGTGNDLLVEEVAVYMSNSAGNLTSTSKRIGNSTYTGDNNRADISFKDYTIGEEGQYLVVAYRFGKNITEGHNFYFTLTDAYASKGDKRINVNGLPITSAKIQVKYSSIDFETCDLAEKPAVGNWTDCTNNKKTRVNYECNTATGTWIQKTDTQTCGVVKKEEGLSTEIIILIILGSIVLLGGIFFAVWYFYLGPNDKLGGSTYQKRFGSSNSSELDSYLSRKPKKPVE